MKGMLEELIVNDNRVLPLKDNITQKELQTLKMIMMNYE